MNNNALSIEVGHAISAAVPQKMACTVYWPERVETSQEQIVIFATPGGGYSQHYYNMHFDGYDGYSEVEYHTSRGLIVVTVDHLGVGQSSIDFVAELTVEQAADAYNSLVCEVVNLLRQGSLAPELEPLDSLFVIGIGQSLGAGVTTVTQSRHAVFDGIALLGKSALHTILPQPTFELFKLQRSLFKFSRTTPPAELIASDAGDQVPDFVYPFHWPDEPEAIRLDDMAGGYPRRDPERTPVYGSATMPIYGMAMMSPGFILPDAARVTCPVLIVGGERDVMPDIHKEPTAFTASSDVSVFIVPRMAHMHNFANTRHQLWRRTADWAQMISASSLDRHPL